MSSTGSSTNHRLAVLGGGNIGGAIARGLVRSGWLPASAITLTRRHADSLAPLASEGFGTTADNPAAVSAADLVILAVAPGHLDGLLDEIAPAVDASRHTLASVVSGVSCDHIRDRLRLDPAPPIIRAMPNTAAALAQSMTCLAGSDLAGPGGEAATALFGAIGLTLIVDEEQMASATALGACGVAFFLRAIRAASQGGIEIGFHAPEAIMIAAQTALGAASLLLSGQAHPERAIDHVTTPRGCTIAGLNEMEHRGFSSAMIKGIVTSATKAGHLYTNG